MTLDWNNPKIFTSPIVPASEDIDGLDHTNNAVYVKWCEQIAWQHSEVLGVSLNDYRQQDRAMAIVRAEYNYLAATRLGETLEISTCLVSCDMKMRMQRDFQIINTAKDLLVFEGSWKFLCIEISSGKPKRIPPLFLDKYGKALVNIT